MAEEVDKHSIFLELSPSSQPCHFVLVAVLVPAGALYPVCSSATSRLLLLLELELIPLPIPLLLLELELIPFALARRTRAHSFALALFVDVFVTDLAIPVTLMVREMTFAAKVVICSLLAINHCSSHTCRMRPST